MLSCSSYELRSQPVVRAFSVGQRGHAKSLCRRHVNTGSGTPEIFPVLVPHPARVSVERVFLARPVGAYPGQQRGQCPGSTAWPPWRVRSHLFSPGRLRLSASWAVALPVALLATTLTW